VHGGGDGRRCGLGADEAVRCLTVGDDETYFGGRKGGESIDDRLEVRACKQCQCMALCVFSGCPT
jgi:hypothetical protein